MTVTQTVSPPLLLSEGLEEHYLWEWLYWYLDCWLESLGIGNRVKTSAN